MHRSAIYFGHVTHQRLQPRRHRLRYAIYAMLFDLDELAAPIDRLRLFSYNRFNLFSFHDRDHGAGQPTGLRAHVEALLAEAGLAPDGGAIRVLCSPRVLGYVFNPLSTYFCHRRSGALAAILYEVNNTFGERHSYLIAVPPTQDDAQGATIRQTCAKSFHVSPFLAMEMTYRFRVAPPADRVSICIQAAAANETVLAAAFSGRRSELTDMVLLKAFLRYPLLTLKIIGGIHWEALRLWLKGVRLTSKPAAPARAVTIVPLQAG